MKGVNSIFK